MSEYWLKLTSCHHQHVHSRREYGIPIMLYTRAVLCGIHVYNSIMCLVYKYFVGGRLNPRTSSFRPTYLLSANIKRTRTEFVVKRELSLNFKRLFVWGFFLFSANRRFRRTDWRVGVKRQNRPVSSAIPMCSKTSDTIHSKAIESYIKYIRCINFIYCVGLQSDIWSGFSLGKKYFFLNPCIM